MILRVFVVACVFSAFCLFAGRVVKEKGEPLVRKIMPGKRPWVFSPLVIRAETCGRTHSRSALPEWCVGLNYFLKIIKII